MRPLLPPRWSNRMRWRVVVEPDTYGQHADVFITRRWFSRFSHNGIHVAKLNLAADNAEDQLAEARAKARSLAQQVAAMDGAKP